MTNASQRPVILAAFANDRSDQTRFLRNLSEEAKRIQSVMEPASALCPLVLLPSATLDEILDAFQKYRDRVVVFHYAGHANGFQLLLESAKGGVHRVGAKGLASFLGQQQGLQLVFLNGCSTERQAEDLLNAGVGCVIATTQSIDDGVATDFSGRFYKGIVTGAPLQSAYAEAVGSAQAASGGSIDRLLVPVEDEEERPHDVGRWPWLLKLRPGAERVGQWNLPDAAGDPLFGLPAVPQRDLPELPYRHLHRFEAEHAEVFFGRGHEIRELYQRVTAANSSPVVMFYGPSGVGKSSLLDAGLIPRLSNQHEVRYLRRHPTSGLGETLRSAFPPETHGLSRRDAWIAAEKQLGRPLTIVLDQIEEVFTKPISELKEELREFCQLLRRIFFAPRNRPQGKLILGFRKEWFAEIDELLADAEVSRSGIFLERLSRRGAIEAILGPANDAHLRARYRLRIEAGLPDLIADDLLADPDTPVAPTLQILLTRMWSEAFRLNPTQPAFDVALYQSLHRNGILLDDFLRQQTAGIRTRLPRVVESGLLLDLLAFHTTSVGTSAEHPLKLLEANYRQHASSGLLQQTLQICEEMYLLTFSGEVGSSPERSSRLLHDTLAPLIRRQHEESDTPGQRARRILDGRMVDWTPGPDGRLREGIPLDSADLKLVEAGVDGTRSWSPDEHRLVEASRQDRVSRRRWARIFKGLGLAAVVAIAIAGGVAYFQWGVAQEQATKAREELAGSQLRQGVSARDQDAEFMKSSHHFAAAAAAISSDQPQKGAALSFAAGRSIVGARLMQSVASPEFVHEAWMLDDGEIRAWTGGPRIQPGGDDLSDYFSHWRQSGELRHRTALQSMFRQCLLDRSGKQLSLFGYLPEINENGIQIAELTGETLTISKPENSAGYAISERDGNALLFWRQGQLILIDTTQQQSSVIPTEPFDGARVSASRDKILTWKTGASATLWSRTAHGTWDQTPLDVRPTNMLVPEFLVDSEECLVWEESGPPGTEGKLDVIGKCFDESGHLLARLAGNKPMGLQAWGGNYWKQVQVLGTRDHLICVASGGETSLRLWRLPTSGDDHPAVPEVLLPFKEPAYYEAIDGLSLSEDGRFVAVLASDRLTLIPLPEGPGEASSPEIRLQLPQTIRDVVFSRDGTTVMTWTSVERPTYGSYVSSSGNRPGSARVWETRTGVPLTAPIRLGKALRGAKFVNQDRGVLLWGEDGLVQHWELTSKPTRPETIMPQPPSSPDGSIRVSSDNTSESLVAVYEPRQQEIVIQTPQNPQSTVMPRPATVSGLQFVSNPPHVLDWGGANGGLGERPGGFAQFWDPRTRQLLSPLLNHQLAVWSAVCSSDHIRILTGTRASPEEPVSHVTAHLWDVALALELMEPISIHGTKRCEARFAPGEGTVVVQAEFGTPPSAYAYDIAHDPALDGTDPRLEIVVRTGTYLNRFGDLTWLTPEAWRELRDAKVRPTFDEWWQKTVADVEAPGNVDSVAE